MRQKLLLCLFLLVVGSGSRVNASAKTDIFVSENKNKHGQDIVTYISDKQQTLLKMPDDKRSEAIHALIKQNKSKKGIFFIVKAEEKNHLSLIPALLAAEFKIQNAIDGELYPGINNVIILKKDILETIRPPAFTTIIVAAVVYDRSQRRIMVIHEDETKSSHKLPGGPLLMNENYEEGARRIIESFGVENAKFHSVLEIKHGPNNGNIMFGKADMLIFCLFSISSLEPAKENHSVEWKDENDANLYNGKKIKKQSNIAALMAFRGFKQAMTEQLEDIRHIESEENPEEKTKPSVTYLFYRDYFSDVLKNLLAQLTPKSQSNLGKSDENLNTHESNNFNEKNSVQNETHKSTENGETENLTKHLGQHPINTMENLLSTGLGSEETQNKQITGNEKIHVQEYSAKVAGNVNLHNLGSDGSNEPPDEQFGENLEKITSISEHKKLKEEKTEVYDEPRDSAENELKNSHEILAENQSNNAAQLDAEQPDAEKFESSTGNSASHHLTEPENGHLGDSLDESPNVLNGHSSVNQESHLNQGLSTSKAQNVVKSGKGYLHNIAANQKQTSILNQSLSESQPRHLIGEFKRNELSRELTNPAESLANTRENHLHDGTAENLHSPMLHSSAVDSVKKPVWNLHSQHINLTEEQKKNKFKNYMRKLRRNKAKALKKLSTNLPPAKQEDLADLPLYQKTNGLKEEKKEEKKRTKNQKRNDRRKHARANTRKV